MGNFKLFNFKSYRNKKWEVKRKRAFSTRWSNLQSTCRKSLTEPMEDPLPLLIAICPGADHASQWFQTTLLSGSHMMSPRLDFPSGICQRSKYLKSLSQN